MAIVPASASLLFSFFLSCARQHPRQSRCGSLQRSCEQHPLRPVSLVVPVRHHDATSCGVEDVKEGVEQEEKNTEEDWIGKRAQPPSETQRRPLCCRMPPRLRSLVTQRTDAPNLAMCGSIPAAALFVHTHTDAAKHTHRRTHTNAHLLHSHTYPRYSDATR